MCYYNYNLSIGYSGFYTKSVGNRRVRGLLWDSDSRTQIQMPHVGSNNQYDGIRV